MWTLRSEPMPEVVRKRHAGAQRFDASLTLRDVNRLVLEADAPPADFAKVGELLEQARALLAQHPTRHADAMEASAVSGVFNAFAPPLVRATALEHGRFRCRGTFGTGYEGLPGLVHGGVIAEILDMCFGAAAGLNGTAAFTGTLTVRYERPTPLGAELIFEAWPERTEGRKLFFAGHVLHDGEPTVTAHAIMIRPKPTPDGATPEPVEDPAPTLP